MRFPSICLSWTLLAVSLSPSSEAQGLIDWDFSSLTNPPGNSNPLVNPALPASAAGAAPELLATDLVGQSADPSYQGLLWTDVNGASGELNLRYWDGDNSNTAGTAGDGINDNYLAFAVAPTGPPVDVGRISISAWRNGTGAVDTYAFEVVVDGGTPIPFGSPVFDGSAGDFGFDWFHFDDVVTVTNSLEVRFRPYSSPGNAGTGHLHINGLRMEVTGDVVEPPSGPNVLFMIADDLTAEALACYGNTQVQTPNLDALASRGMLFERTYCQFPVCAPSRASLLSGQYTARLTGAGGSFSNLDSVLGAHPTMPEYFKLNGYVSTRISKLYHMRVPGDIRAGVSGPDHGPSWSQIYNVQAPEWNTPGATGHYTNETLNFDPNTFYNSGFGASFYTVEATTSGAEQADVLAADRAHALLGQLQNQRFFMAVGFVRPHVPLVAPVAHYAPYPEQTIQLADSVPGDLNDIPGPGVFWNEPSRGPNSDLDRRLVRRAYYASVSFMDEQVGRLLDRLDELDLADNTIVVFTSDHGYHLGEHTMWQKLSLHEESASVPLIVAGPGVAANVRTEALSELVDLYPTLSELAGLPVPPDCQGRSLKAVLEDPLETVRSCAYSRVNGGHLLRTDTWAYMRYTNGSEELYAMTDAPVVGDMKQFNNLAGNAAYAPTLDSLRGQLDEKLIAVASDTGLACCFRDFCAGAGGDQLGCTDCPCQNNAPLGSEGGCRNSVGTSAILVPSGLPAVIDDTLRFEVTDATPNTFGILQSANNRLPNAGLCPPGSGLTSAVLDGLRCVGGAALRHGTRPTDANGDAGVTTNGWGFGSGPSGGILAASGFMSGQTRHFQCFYREDVALGCTTGQNTTQAVSVTFR